MEKVFRNEERTRRYGLRVGDLVSRSIIDNHSVSLEVISINGFDNNRVVVRELQTNHIYDEVAEYCTLVTKVEDRELVRREMYVTKEIYQFIMVNFGGYFFFRSEKTKAFSQPYTAHYIKVACGEHYPHIQNFLKTTGLI
jgi:hypothetical protein